MSAEEYSWRNLECYFAGRLLINLEEVNYKRDQEIEVFYGPDGEPTGWGSGEIKSEGSISISGQEYSNIIDYAVAYGYDILKMPPLPLILIIKSEDLPTMRHILTQVKFKENGFDGKNKDKRFVHKLPFVIVGPVQITKGV
jgi:hypothetical protein